MAKTSSAMKRTAATSRISGDVSFETMMSASKNRVSFSGDVTVTSNRGGAADIVSSGRKKNLESMIESENINDAVVSMRRDKAGENDLKRMQNLGFEVKARTLGESSGGSTPPKDYYYMVRTGTAKPQEAQPSRQRTATKKRDTSVNRDNEVTTREQRRLARANKAQARAARNGRPFGSR